MPDGTSHLAAELGCNVSNEVVVPDLLVVMTGIISFICE